MAVLPVQLGPGTRALLALLDFARQVGFAGGEQEYGAQDCADDGVEVDAGPDDEAVAYVEEDEGGGAEGEGELGDEVGEEVVDAFRGEGGLAVGLEEEGAEETAGV